MNDNPIIPNVTAKITWLNDNSSPAKKATASIVIGNAFQVNGLSVVEGSKGLFVSMPQKAVDKDGTRKYVEWAHPVCSEMRSAINDAVLGAYSMRKALDHPCQKRLRKTSRDETPVSEKNDTEDSLEVLTEERDSSEDEEENLIMGQVM